MYTIWILIYHTNTKGKINFIKSTWKSGKLKIKVKLVKYFKTTPRIYSMSNKSQIIGNVCLWFEVGWKEGVKYFDREKDLRKIPLGIQETDVKGERL